MHHAIQCRLSIIQSFIGLSSFNIDLPAQLSVDVLEHLINYAFEAPFMLKFRSATCLLVKSQILKPQRAILPIEVQSLFTKGEGSLDFSFSLFVFRGL